MKNNLEKLIERLQSVMSENYTKKFVCFVDVLGYSDQSKHSQRPSDIALPNLLINQMKDANKEYGENLTIALFSDCAYILAEKKDIDALINYVSILYLQLLTQNINSEDSIYRHALLRGGITFGDVFWDEETNFVAGPAVAEAYELESKKAVYPRIIVDCLANKELQSLTKQLHIVTDKELKDYLYLDFLNRIRDTRGLSNMSLSEPIQWVKERKENEPCKKIQEKYKWMENYLAQIVK